MVFIEPIISFKCDATVLSCFVFIIISFVIGVILCPIVIPMLRKLKFGQNVRDDGPETHLAKQGTPTMGGVAFLLAFVITSFFFLKGNMDGAAIMLMTLCYGLIGFLDDYIKVVKKRNLGLIARYKVAGQIIVTAAFLYGQYYIGHINTRISVPFTTYSFELGMWYYPIVFLAIIFMVNAVNLTDGIDGLCSSVSFVVALGFMVISAAYGYYTNALFAVAIAGGCAGFLVWNFYPAKVFMGDTGSMFLGGAVVAMAWAVNRPEILIFMGLIYACEALSVVIQVLYFKATHGKRIFKMSPIHHHYEMSGWSEWKIVIVFCLVGAIGAAISILAVTMI